MLEKPLSDASAEDQLRQLEEQASVLNLTVILEDCAVMMEVILEDCAVTMEVILEDLQ